MDLAEKDECESRGESSHVRVAEAPPLGGVPDGTDGERDDPDELAEDDGRLLSHQPMGRPSTPYRSRWSCRSASPITTDTEPTAMLRRDSSTATGVFGTSTTIAVMHVSATHKAT